MEKTAVSSVAKDKDIARIALVGVPNEVGTSFKVFSLLAQNHINVDIILQGVGHEEGKDICFTVAEWDLKKAAELLASHKDELRFTRLETNADIAKVSVVGSGMINNPGVAAKLFEALYDAHININIILPARSILILICASYNTSNNLAATLLIVGTNYGNLWQYLHFLSFSSLVKRSSSLWEVKHSALS